MATKKQSSKTRSAARTATRGPAVVEHIENPAEAQRTEVATPVIIQRDDIKLDLSISMGDLSDMVATDARAALIGVRNEITVKLNGIKAEHAELEKRLQELAIEVVRGVESDPQAKSLSDALAIFHGIPFGVTSDDVNISTEEQLVRVDVVVATAVSIEAHLKSEAERVNHQGSYYGGYGSGYQKENEKTVARPFSPEMAAIIVQMREVAQRAANTQLELDKTSHLLTDMPNLAARARSALTKAYLAGKLRTGEDMLRELADVGNQVDRALLPAAFRNEPLRALNAPRG